MQKIKDTNIGLRFGRLEVLEYANGNGRSRRYLCKCDCGTVRTFCYEYMKRGSTRSCGCLKRETSANRFRTHGFSNSKLHGVWATMKARCYNDTQDSYKFYGGRGIKVCDEWREDFVPFLNWAMENGYEEGLSLDRINPDVDYGPDNCRWATSKQQARNKRNTNYINYAGARLSLNDMCEKHGIISENVRQYRRKHKLTPLQAFVDFVLRKGLNCNTIGRPTDEQAMKLESIRKRLYKLTGNLKDGNDPAHYVQMLIKEVEGR